jgi:hypothetical protein
MRERERTERWRRDQRVDDLRRVAKLAANARWSGALLAQLLTELAVNDLFFDLIGDPHQLPVRRYPQAVTVALALRHSWRRDDLAQFAKRLGIKLKPRASVSPAASRRKA